jgi:23S rRNA (guanine745-N1)-methyltransferase
MDSAVVALLRCPVCGADLTADAGSLVCLDGHRYDIARQGYVSLLAAGANTGTADTADMVSARSGFLRAGHYSPIVQALLAEAARAASEGAAIVDLGAGPGYYLGAAMDAAPGSIGLALDVSKYAARAAAKVHPRVGAVVCDVWQTLPVRDAVADVVLDIFAPRNVAEIRRILRPHGVLLVVTPAADHLRELVAALELVTVDPDKAERLERDMTAMALLRRTSVRFSLQLDRAAVEAVVLMGPSGHHIAADELRARVLRLPDPLAVTAAVDVRVYGRGH